MKSMELSGHAKTTKKVGDCTKSTTLAVNL